MVVSYDSIINICYHNNGFLASMTSSLLRKIRKRRTSGHMAFGLDTTGSEVSSLRRTEKNILESYDI